MKNFTLMAFGHARQELERNPLFLDWSQERASATQN